MSKSNTMFLLFTIMSLTVNAQMVSLRGRPFLGPIPFPKKIQHSNSQKKKNVVIIRSKDTKGADKELTMDIKLAVQALLQNKERIIDYVSYQDFKKIVQALKYNQLDAYIKEVRLKKIHIKSVNDKGANPILNPAYITLREIGASLRAQRDKKNIFEIYKKIYNSISEKNRQKFIYPNKLQRVDIKKIKIEISKINSFILKHLNIFNRSQPIPVPNSFKLDCTKETGIKIGRNGDLASRCSQSEYASRGLFKNNNFALKYKHTCIKNQGGRGTCVSFAINAAVESMFLAQEGVSYNLSEQFTYFYGEIYGSWKRRYDYGLPSGSVIKAFKKRKIRFQYEKYWQYNTSFNIDSILNSFNGFDHSCDNYNGAMCTNFAFQAQESSSGSRPFKTWKYTTPRAGTNKIFEIKKSISYYRWSSPKNSLIGIIPLLNANTPVIVSFSVKNNFQFPDENGYVRYLENEDTLGGHTALLIGYVSNSQIPSGVPKAKENGYFIVKNSWGLRGDCGYYYVDFKYFRKYITDLRTLEMKTI